MNPVVKREILLAVVAIPLALVMGGVAKDIVFGKKQPSAVQRYETTCLAMGGTPQRWGAATIGCVDETRHVELLTPMRTE